MPGILPNDSSFANSARFVFVIKFEILQMLKLRQLILKAMASSPIRRGRPPVATPERHAAFVAGQPPDLAHALRTFIQWMGEAVPEAVPVWAWGVPCFHYGGGYLAYLSVPKQARPPQAILAMTRGAELTPAPGLLAGTDRKLVRHIVWQPGSLPPDAAAVRMLLHEAAALQLRDGPAVAGFFGK